MKRRMFLKTASATLAITGAAGIAWFNTRTPIKATEPWKSAATGYGDIRIDILAFALLAPSPHNTQPWKVDLVDDDTIDVFCDLDRRLPKTDPFDRQIVIGLGCFVELAVIAASQKGYRAYVTPFPDGEPHQKLDQRKIARIKLVNEGIKANPLALEIFKRRSIKEAFDPAKTVSAKNLKELTSESKWAQATNDLELVPKLNTLAYDAMTVEFATPHTLKESADLMRIGKAEINAQPDGIDIAGAPMELLNLLGVVTRETLSDVNSHIVIDYLNGLKPLYHSTTGYLWVSSPNNSRASQLQAGREYVRLNLKAAQLGISIHPVSQALQEYSEMTQLYSKVHSMLTVQPSETIQMLARVGYGPEVAETPRWPVETILKRV